MTSTESLPVISSRANTFSTISGPDLTPTPPLSPSPSPYTYSSSLRTTRLRLSCTRPYFPHSRPTLPPSRKRPTRSTQTLTTNLLRRKATLKNDPLLDATKLTAKSVWCVRCQKSIKLDARNDYYPGLWRKHRDLFHREGWPIGKGKGTSVGEGEVKGVGGQEQEQEFRKEKEDAQEEAPKVETDAREVTDLNLEWEVPPKGDIPTIDEHQAAVILSEMLTRFSSSLLRV